MNRERPGKLQEYVLPLGFYILLLAVAFHRLYIPDDDGAVRVLGWDMLNEYWPDFCFRFNALSRGEWPLWNPFDQGGMPWVSRIQVMLLYPPSWLLGLAWTPEGSVSITGLQLFVTGHFLLLGFTAHRWVAGHCKSLISPYFSGTILLLGGAFLVQKNSSFIWPLCWLPLIAITLEDLVRAPSPRRALYLALVLSTALTASNPPAIFTLSLSVGLYFLALLALDPSQGPEPGRRRLLTLLYSAAVGVVLILCLAAVYVPGLQIMEEVARDTSEAGYLDDRSLPLAAFQFLINPLAGHPWWFSMFLSGTGVVLTFLGVFFAPARRMLTLALPAAFLLVLAPGSEVGLLDLLAEHLPGFGLFRKSYRYLIPAAVLLAPLAGIAADRLLALGGKQLKTWTRREVVGVGLAGALTILLAVLAVQSGQAGELSTVADWESLYAGRLVGLELLLFLLVLVPTLIAKNAHLRLAGSLMMLALVVGSLLLGNRITDATTETERTTGEAGVIERARLEGEGYRLGPSRFGRTGMSSRYMFRASWGYEHPMALRRQQDLVTWADKNPARLSLFNVKLIESCAKQNSKVTEKIEKCRWRIRNPVPRVAFYPGIMQIRSAEKVLKNLWVAKAKHQVIMEPQDLTRQLMPLVGRKKGKVVEGRVLEDGINFLTVEVEAPGEGMVLINEIWHRWWRAKVDGEEVPLHRVNYALRGVQVTRGTHTIEMTFEVPGYLPLLIISVTTYLLLLASSVLSALGPVLMRRRRERAGPSRPL